MIYLRRVRRAAAAVIVGLSLVVPGVPASAQASASADTSGSRYDKARRLVGTISRLIRTAPAC